LKKTTLLYAGLHRFFMIFLAVCASFQLSGQKQDKIKAEFTAWYQNKAGAISLSFDDAGYSQYAFAYPLLEKYGYKGTFSIIGQWTEDDAADFAESGFFDIKRMGWKQLNELQQHGHELSAHGMVHEKYDKFAPVPELADKMKEIKTLIESKTEAQVFTLHYPYSYASGNIPPAAKEAGYLFGRTGLDTINSALPPDMFLLGSEAVLNGTLPDSAMFSRWITEAGNKWLILMYHHFFTANSKEMSIMQSHEVEYSYSITPGEFEKQLEMISGSGYWVATISEVGKYIIQREYNEIMVSVRKKKIDIQVGSSLDNTVYNQPMTIEVVIPWKKVKVSGSIHDGVFDTIGKKIFIDILPEQLIILSKG
jgi:peptidoglycan/xylan/chitin deacetylase (PgdA/CDA1 family)